MSLNSRIARTKRQIHGTAERPRLSLTVSNNHVYAQIIDDTAGHTIVFSSSLAGGVSGTMTEKARWAGGDIAKKARQAGVTRVVFDRRGRRYHGRVAGAAEAAREQGLEF